MTQEPSAWSGVLGFILMGAIFYGLLRFEEWRDGRDRARWNAEWDAERRTTEQES